MKKGEWRCALEDCGAVCVMTTGAPTMLKWSAENWDMEMMVRLH